MLRKGQVARPEDSVGADEEVKDPLVLGFLGLVEKHARITRKEAADLCQIASPQARNLLARLVKRGELVLRGQRKGAYYERSAINMDASKKQNRPSINRPNKSKH